MCFMIKSDRSEETKAMTANLQKYIAFITAAEYGSFTKAAEILQYSQSGISRMIHDLESEWNVVLLERGKSGARLTSDGIRLLPFVRNICNDYRQLETQVSELNGLRSGMIRIGTFTSVSSHWIPNIIAAFQKDYPNIDYELLLGDYAEIENWILEGRVDCGFLRLPTQACLETLFLDKDELMVILPEDHSMADCKVFPMNSLNEYPFLLLEKNDNTEISEIFKQNNLTPDIRCTTWDDYAILSLVERGFGISILPRLILHRIPYHIVARPLELPIFRKIGLAVREWETTSLAVKKFAEYLSYREAGP